MKEVIKLFKQIQETSSTNDKKAIIVANKDNELFKKCLVFLLDGNIFCNIENSTQLWDEFVVGFREYKEDNSDKCLWNEFMDKIEKQYEDKFAIQRW